MPNRILREAINASEAINGLEWAEEVFYRRLMSIVDDYGRHEAGHQLLRAKCYPLKTEKVRVTDISRWIAACVKAGLILEYENNGKRYIEILKFGQQIRSNSRCPAPADSLPAIASNGNHLITNAHLGGGVSVSVCGGVLATPDKPKQLSDSDFVASLRSNPAYRHIDVDRELAKMDAWLQTPKGKRRQKTRGFIVNWLNKIDAPVNFEKDSVDDSGFWEDTPEGRKPTQKYFDHVKAKREGKA